MTATPKKKGRTSILFALDCLNLLINWRDIHAARLGAIEKRLAALDGGDEAEAAHGAAVAHVRLDRVTKGLPADMMLTTADFPEGRRP